MGLYKRGNIWWISYTYTGKQIRESSGSKNKKTAEKLLAKRLAAVFEGRFDLRNIKPSPKFSEYAEEYLEVVSKVNKKPESYRRDRLSLKHLKKFFKGKKLNEINPILVEHYKRKRLEEGKAPGTVNRELSCLKHLFSIAVRDKDSLSNPVKEVKLLKLDNEIMNVLSQREEIKLLENCSPHIRAIVICALETGMRRGEILNLRWENVDLRRRLIHVKKTKTGKDREIPISDRLLKVVKGQNRFAEYVFTFEGEEIGSVKTGYKAALRRAGLKHFRFHDLRHTAATRWIEDGVDVFTVQRLLGHSSVTTTQRYAHPGLESMRNAVDRLGRVGYDSGLEEEG